jgi:UDP-N-acetylmuramate dehydrogenase
MQLQQNISLKKYNTFAIDVLANYFLQISSTDELAQYFDYQKLSSAISHLPTCILGGGSNILFTKNYDGVIIKNNLLGIEKIKEDDNHIFIKAAAGENWHRFVMHCIDNNWCGVENLALIPGNVGASPMQNIGAYGVEIKDVFYELEAFSIADKKIATFTKSDCAFGYRESIFKTTHKNQFVITSVTFKLNKIPVFNISYGAIKQELEKMGVQQLSIHAIANAVINIRKSKLPDPTEIGNAGSFFKNPTVTNNIFIELKNKFPAIVGYELPNDTVKLAAGWLIEQCGWKGFRKNDAGCHAKQALVLVNYGNATGNEIYELSNQIIESIEQKFNIMLEREVNII